MKLGLREAPRTRREFYHGRLRQPKPQQMGVQIPCGVLPCGVHSQVRQEDALRGIAATPRGGVSQTGDAKGKQSRGRPSDAGSCSHDDLDPAEIRGLASDRLHQEQERDPFGPCLRGAEAQFHRPALWARGYFVSTVGRDEAVIREYIRKQEAEDSRLDQLNMWR